MNDASGNLKLDISDNIVLSSFPAMLKKRKSKVQKPPIVIGEKVEFSDFKEFQVSRVPQDNWEDCDYKKIS